MRFMIALLRLGRPLFLGGGFLLYALGAAIAAWHGHAIDGTRYALGQAAITAFQLMTHYANDYFDYDADLANQTPTRWSGGSRVLVADQLPRGVALAAALVLAVLGFGVTAVIARVAGAWAASTLIATFALAWAYSAPPLRLCARGLGELTTAIVVTGLVPWLAFYLQAPAVRGVETLVVAVVPLAALQFAMLLAIELPDAAGDAATGKRTLVVRLGAERGARLYVLATAAAFLWLPVGYLLGLPGRAVVAALVPAPLAVWRIARSAEHRDPAAFERLTLSSVLLLVATASATLIAFVSAT